MIELVKAFLTHFTYLALILVLFAAGMGVPIPEDIPLIFSGYLCHPTESAINSIPDADTEPETSLTAPALPPVIGPENQTSEKPRTIPNLYLMMVAGMIGVLGGDSIVFHIGRTGVHGNSFVSRHVRKVLNSKRRERIDRFFSKHGNLTVFVGRFAPGIRSAIFALAGMSGMSYTRFILIDGFAAIISVPTFIYVGYHFAAVINDLFTKITRIKEIALPVIVLAVLIGVIIFIVKRRRKKAIA